MMTNVVKYKHTVISRCIVLFLIKIEKKSNFNYQLLLACKMIFEKREIRIKKYKLPTVQIEW